MNHPNAVWTFFTVISLVAAACGSGAQTSQAESVPTSSAEVAEGVVEQAAPDAEDDEPTVPEVAEVVDEIQENPGPIDPNTAIATRIDVDFEFDHQAFTVSGGEAFALANADGKPLRVSRSQDGVGWVETDPVTFSAEGSENLGWDFFASTDSGFVLESFDRTVSEGPTFATSPNGVNWEVLDVAWQPEIGDYPIAVRPEGLTVFERLDGTTPIGNILQTHTNLGPIDSAVCFVADVGPSRLHISLCGGLGTANLDSSNVVSGTDPNAVLDCVELLGSRGHTGLSRVRFIGGDQAPDASQEFPEGVRSSLGLPGARVAVITHHLSDATACDGVVDLPDSQGSALALLDAELNVQASYRLPEEIGGRFVQIIGTMDFDSSSAEFVFIRTQSELFALDTESGEWQEILDVTSAGATSIEFVENVIYRDLPRGLGVIEIDHEPETGSLVASERVLTYDAGPDSAGPVSSPPGFWAIERDRLLVVDVSGVLWSITIPPSQR